MEKDCSGQPEAAAYEEPTLNHRTIGATTCAAAEHVNFNLSATPLTFNQSRLEVFTKCARKFYLQYLAQRYFPPRHDMPTQAQATQLAQGTLMHKYMERALRGVDMAALTACAPTPIREWLEDAYLFVTQLPAGERLVECTLSMPFDDTYLTARYDLIALTQDGQATIVDWKTSANPTPAARLRQRMQHVVFPYVLVESGLLGAPSTVEPSQVEMVYWFTTDPLTPVRFAYSRAAHQQNQTQLQAMVRAIKARTTEADFPKVEDSPHNRRHLCAFCSYMQHCERGATPVTSVDLDDVFEEPAILDPQAWLDDGLELDF